MSRQPKILIISEYLSENLRGVKSRFGVNATIISPTELKENVVEYDYVITDELNSVRKVKSCFSDKGIRKKADPKRFLIAVVTKMQDADFARTLGATAVLSSTDNLNEFIKRNWDLYLSRG